MSIDVGIPDSGIETLRGMDSLTHINDEPAEELQIDLMDPPSQFQARTLAPNAGLGPGPVTISSMPSACE